MAVKKRRKIAVLVLVGVIVAVPMVTVVGGVLWIVLPRRKVRALDANFTLISRGMSESEVVGVMGSAGKAGHIGPSPQAYWDDKRLSDAESARIVRTREYRVETFFLPITFEITFDESGHVVGRHRYD